MSYQLTKLSAVSGAELSEVSALIAIKNNSAQDVVQIPTTDIGGITTANAGTGITIAESGGVNKINIKYDTSTLEIDTNNNLKVKGGGVSPYVLPIASASTLGGIKVGNGLAIDSNGALRTSSIDSANVTYDNADTSLLSTNVGAAIDELDRTKLTVDDGQISLSRIELTNVVGANEYAVYIENETSSYATNSDKICFYGDSDGFVKLGNVDNPVGDHDAANKAYVDSKRLCRDDLSDEWPFVGERPFADLCEPLVSDNGLLKDAFMYLTYNDCLKLGIPVETNYGAILVANAITPTLVFIKAVSTDTPNSTIGNIYSCYFNKRTNAWDSSGWIESVSVGVTATTNILTT